MIIDDFNAAVAKSKELTQRPTNEELLELYGLFKQSTEGDLNEPRPTGFDFKAIAKHDVWESKKGKSKEEAMGEYMALMEKLYQKYK